MADAGRLCHRRLRERSARIDGSARPSAHDAGRPLDGWSQRDGVRGLASGAHGRPRRRRCAPVPSAGSRAAHARSRAPPAARARLRRGGRGRISDAATRDDRGPRAARPHGAHGAGSRRWRLPLSLQSRVLCRPRAGGLLVASAPCDRAHAPGARRAFARPAAGDGGTHARNPARRRARRDSGRLSPRDARYSGGVHRRARDLSATRGMSLEEILERASWPDGPLSALAGAEATAPPARRAARRRRAGSRRRRRRHRLPAARARPRAALGGPEMAPQTPQRSSRPGEAVALLGHARVIRTAQTLYSGIFDDGSNAALVRKLAADSPSFTNGTKIAPGFTASVTRA